MVNAAPRLLILRILLIKFIDVQINTVDVNSGCAKVTLTAASLVCRGRCLVIPHLLLNVGAASC